MRVCHDDSDYYSYTEIPIDCVSQGLSYSLIQVRGPHLTGAIQRRKSFVLKKSSIEVGTGEIKSSESLDKIMRGQYLEEIIQETAVL